MTRLVTEVPPDEEVMRFLPDMITLSLGGSSSACGSTDRVLAADQALAGGDKVSHLLKLDQRTPAWIKLALSLFLLFFFLERDYYDYASKNKYILIL